jgi:hypothetical protein
MGTCGEYALALLHVEYVLFPSRISRLAEVNSFEIRWEEGWNTVNAAFISLSIQIPTSTQDGRLGGRKQENSRWKQCGWKYGELTTSMEFQPANDTHVLLAVCNAIELYADALAVKEFQHHGDGLNMS